MALYKAQISFPFNSEFPRDRVSINPHFAGDNAGGLADALVQNLINVPAITAARPFTVKIYDALKAPPSYPLATRVNGTGQWDTDDPGEVALCLSYYAGFNRPSTRGRLYLPAAMLTGALGLRPTAAQITQALTFRNVFVDNLPPGHRWNTYSPTTGGSEPVTNVWVDDEWDTVRSRGQRSTTRQTAVVTPNP